MPKQPKKILITKFYTDVSEFSDAVIDLQKAFMKVAAGDARVEFEVITEDTTAADNATAERLLRLVRSEFKVADTGLDDDDEKTMDES